MCVCVCVCVCVVCVCSLHLPLEQVHDNPSGPTGRADFSFFLSFLLTYALFTHFCLAWDRVRELRIILRYSGEESNPCQRLRAHIILPSTNDVYVSRTIRLYFCLSTSVRVHIDITHTAKATTVLETRGVLAHGKREISTV